VERWLNGVCTLATRACGTHDFHKTAMLIDHHAVAIMAFLLSPIVETGGCSKSSPAEAIPFPRI
jgi:hypothetical protein